MLSNQGGPKAGPQTEKQHPPTVVAAECLHGGVVDNSNRFAQCGRKIEPDPPGAQVAWFGLGAMVADLARITDGNGLIIPVGGQFADGFNHLLRRHLRSRGLASWFRLASNEN